LAVTSGRPALPRDGGDRAGTGAHRGQRDHLPTRDGYNVAARGGDGGAGRVQRNDTVVTVHALYGVTVRMYVLTNVHVSLPLS